MYFFDLRAFVFSRKLNNEQKKWSAANRKEKAQIHVENEIQKLSVCNNSSANRVAHFSRNTCNVILEPLFWNKLGNYGNYCCNTKTFLLFLLFYVIVMYI